MGSTQQGSRRCGICCKNSSPKMAGRYLSRATSYSEVEQMCTHQVVIRSGKLVFQGQVSDLLDAQNVEVIARPEDPADLVALGTLADQLGKRATVVNGQVTIAASDDDFSGQFNRAAMERGITLVHLTPTDLDSKRHSWPSPMATTNPPLLPLITASGLVCAMPSPVNGSSCVGDAFFSVLTWRWPPLRPSALFSRSPRRARWRAVWILPQPPVSPHSEAPKASRPALNLRLFSLV